MKVAAIVVCLMMVTSEVSADRRPSREWEQIAASLRANGERQVTVTLRDDTTIQGTVMSVGRSSFLVANPLTGVATQVPFRKVKRVNAMSTGAKVAVIAAAAGVLYLFLCPATTDPLCGFAGN